MSDGGFEKGVGQGCGMVVGAILAILALLFLCCGGPGLISHDQPQGSEQRSGANSSRP